MPVLKFNYEINYSFLDPLVQDRACCCLRLYNHLCCQKTFDEADFQHFSDPIMTLCAACRKVPASFFERNDKIKSDLSHLLVLGPRVPHWPVDLLIDSANSGCELCVILASTIDADFLPPAVRACQPTELRRGIIDPHSLASEAQLQNAEIGPNSTFALYVGVDDISYGFFFSVPSLWSRLLLVCKETLLTTLVEKRYLPPLLASPADDIALGKTWLDDCTNGHIECSTMKATLLPNRLLKLNAFRESMDLKLVELDTLKAVESVAYTALSHCWGVANEQKQIVTKRTNLDERRRCISYEHLSQTFQDAVRITRGLGIDFLWIDSLCIIQDSREDWEREASRMSQTYAGSYCTLAASAASDGSGGCRRSFHNTGMTRSARYVDLDLSSTRVRMFERSPLDWESELELGPLRRRGWTLQERELSPRIIHFAENLLLWECRTSKASSELPWFQMNTKDPPAALLYNQPEDADPESRTLELREYWCGVVEDFSQRNVTKQQDRLPALDGLAQTAKQNGRGEYLAGVWKADLPSALLWQVVPDAEKDRCCKLDDYQAPSWSWASVACGVTYTSQRSWQVYSLDDKDRVRSECNFRGFCIEDAQVIHRTEESTSAVLSGSLHVLGSLFAVNLSSAPTHHAQSNRFALVQSSSGSTTGILYFDCKTEASEHKSIYFARIRDEAGKTPIQVPFEVFEELEKGDYLNEPMCMGVALLPETASETRYRRIGIVRFARSGHFADQHATRYEIV